MPSPLDYLEYGEEDDSGQEDINTPDNDDDDDDASLFGSDDDQVASVPDLFKQDTRIPITTASSSSTPASPPPPPREPTYKPIASSSSAYSNDRPHRVTTDERMAQLRSKRARASPAPEMGVPSLKLFCTIGEEGCIHELTNPPSHSHPAQLWTHLRHRRHELFARGRVHRQLRPRAARGD